VRAAGVAASVIAAAALVGAGCGSVATGPEASSGRGEELFKEKCGQCHELAAAGTRGTVGPNLDEAFDDVRKGEQKFDDSTIRDVVRGQIAYPVEVTPSGEPGMPADIVTGADADAVAAYVASVAGVPGAGEGGITATAGEEIFAAAGCGSCHVLAAAGSEGTIGPNLDESKPSKELAVDRVTNGKGQMPSFKDQLKPEQIEAVAEYVSSAAG
jgi:cbb3-type cytochrome c oxidase subunit III